MATLQADSSIVYEFVNPLISKINSLMTKIVPGMEVYMAIAISFFIAYLLKKKHNWNNASLVSAGVLIFAGLRYFGFGG